MFFLGVAFALLEVKALTTFALLFGSTWNVNSLVFFAILASVLIAVLVNARFTFRRIWIFYVLLFGMLALNLVVRPEALLFQNAIARYVIASCLIFAPVFLANVIFSNSFRETELADVAFASNLLGIMVGGMLEYFSMLTGYHLLLVAVIAFYFLAMVLRGPFESQPARSRRSDGSVSQSGVRCRCRGRTTAAHSVLKVILTVPKLSFWARSHHGISVPLSNS